ncbi:hypothetical protein [Goodfellowiella coeruleoviolacea]|uniref:Uncharacterized protein n=1 Tax=Goodfellowiella coeruleoviolacea TaxID=334858 RepID=A0AAE3GBF6_9PSEU|nr:hypothetical protein [Goodfellowiella coeruleoviolacea]MCP2164304.1 hypothetical protein [Goodfellowiella coeruleoviolacea]
MTKALLAIHVLAAIIAVGPVTVAASMFPAAARRARALPDDAQAVAVLRTLHRICRIYAAIGVVVPVFGLATASSLGVMGDAWLVASIVLTALAAAVLALIVLPGQTAVLAEFDTTATPTSTATSTGATITAVSTATAVTGTAQRAAARLAMYTGVFNLLWATVTVLMIVRPGSTTGV